MIITKRTKLCSKCEEIKPKSDFHNDKSREDGLQSYCKPCKNGVHLKYQKTDTAKKNHVDVIRKSQLKSKYGITQDEYDLNLELQDDACKICKTDASEFTKKLSVDHNHETGEVRGLLCPSCNSGLGQFKDNIEFLEEAIEYLKKSKFFKMLD